MLRLSYSDHITALSVDVRIVEQGPFKHLRNAWGYVQSLATKIKAEDTTTTPEKESDISTKPAPSRPDDKVAIQELNRQRGDFAVCKYYCSSIG